MTGRQTYIKMAFLSPRSGLEQKTWSVKKMRRVGEVEEVPAKC